MSTMLKVLTDLVFVLFFGGFLAIMAIGLIQLVVQF